MKRVAPGRLANQLGREWPNVSPEAVRSSYTTCLNECSRPTVTSSPGSAGGQMNGLCANARESIHFGPGASETSSLSLRFCQLLTRTGKAVERGRAHTQ